RTSGPPSVHLAEDSPVVLVAILSLEKEASMCARAALAKSLVLLGALVLAGACTERSSNLAPTAPSFSASASSLPHINNTALPIPVAISADFSAYDCSNNPGPQITFSGGSVLGGRDLHGGELREQSRALHQLYERRDHGRSVRAHHLPQQRQPRGRATRSGRDAQRRGHPGRLEPHVPETAGARWGRRQSLDLRRVHRRRRQGAGRPDAAGSLRAAEQRAELSGEPQEAEPGRKATGSAFPAPLCRMSQSEPVALRHVMEFTTRLSLGERMPHVQYWARVRADQDCPLRQGAWYRVVELTPVEAIVDVNHRLLHIPRAFVQVLP